MAEKGHPVDPSKIPRDLTSEEWMYMVEAFLAWPFRPEVRATRLYFSQHTTLKLDTIF